MAPRLYSVEEEANLPPDETSPLLHSSGDGQDLQPKKRSPWTAISVILVGVLVANIDMTLLLATYPQISSSFGALTHGSWLLTAYMLSMCAAQPLYGKLSGIFGRKAMLIVSYTLYATGSAVCGLGQRMGQVILGRVIAGTGGAGMVCLVSIIITDLVPLRQVAEYRSYMNVIQTFGRSIGAPIGGLITERFGWRATFGTLCPITILGIGLVAWKLQDQPPEVALLGSTPTPQNHKGRYWALLRRIDTIGSLLLAFSIAAALMVFTIGSEKLPWTSPIMVAIVATAVAGAVAFYIWETHYACEPIFPPSLLAHRAVWTSYIMLLLQNAAQSAATLSVPLFFQVTQGMNSAEAGMFLLPSVVGNTLGALGTGNYIKRTGRYKLPGVAAGIFGVLGYGLMIARWDAGPDFNLFWDDCYLAFAGLATGMAHSAAFVILTAGIAALEGDGQGDSENTAIASSGIYLSGNIGGVVGLCMSSTMLRSILRRELSLSLDEATMRRAMEDVTFVQGLERGSKLRTIIVAAYVDGFRGTFWGAAVYSALTTFVSLFVNEHSLTG
ncbi:major facilitator superfamily domain-containing protein [Phialemonium atrogriseum]|uniref:Major facilitator superfamily domain-containing protein n=1 Tax=Phialemonium atrogriseum TaxID=1093897 RepID=A0AAJ0C6T8_9PEZI|nr:major facilitator superfamily domain-containing protein [Phialemonium atrogriseum]KAK1770043.1 major facilitator superfamily domain-containing protein [Phialemonium atrogriseum]